MTFVVEEAVGDRRPLELRVVRFEATSRISRRPPISLVETGSLYPALHRLEKSGWLKSEWGVSEANQRAKYYRLTAAGKVAVA